MRSISDSPLSAQDIRAAAEVHRELGPDYDNAVVESFLSKIDDHIEQRVEQRLARVTRRPADPVRPSKYRTAFAGIVAGSVVAGAPLTALAWVLLRHAYGNPRPLLWIWALLAAVYGLTAYRLTRR